MTPLKLPRRRCLCRLVMARMVMGAPALDAHRVRIRLPGRPTGLGAAGTTRGARGMALPCTTDFFDFSHNRFLLSPLPEFDIFFSSYIPLQSETSLSLVVYACMMRRRRSLVLLYGFSGARS
jgi:hypothetical protein